MKSILREKSLLLVANVLHLIWKHLRGHGWPAESDVMCKIKDLHEALCFEAQMERYCHCQADEIGWFAWQFWMLRARIWRAACKALQKLGMTDMPF